MDFLKKHQVVEHEDGKWSVVRVESQSTSGAALIGSITMRCHGFNTAAEAQEIADDLNEVKNEESN